jgi:hypothetical protein
MADSWVDIRVRFTTLDKLNLVKLTFDGSILGSRQFFNAARVASEIKLA